MTMRFTGLVDFHADTIRLGVYTPDDGHGYVTLDIYGVSDPVGRVESAMSVHLPAEFEGRLRRAVDKFNEALQGKESAADTEYSEEGLPR